MGENIDEAKGRAKEAAGDLTDDDGLKREGKVDQAMSDIKEKVDDAADKVKDVLNRDKNRDARAHAGKPAGAAPRPASCCLRCFDRLLDVALLLQVLGGDRGGLLASMSTRALSSCMTSRVRPSWTTRSSPGSPVRPRRPWTGR